MDEESRIKHIVNRLLERKTVLNQYALWLETGEEFTKYNGKDVRDMLLGSMLIINGDLDFIPGIDHRNYVEVIRQVQKETGLDLGVCQYLDEGPEETLANCKAKEGLSIGSLYACIPPNRADCKHRIKKLEEEADSAR